MPQRIGERLNDDTAPRYIKHPPGATGWLVDGKPLDAGTGHILSSNLSHLSGESSLDHLVWDVGVSVPKVNNRGYAGLDDVAEPPVSDFDDATNPAVMCSWDRRTARCYGPFFGLIDRDLTGAQAGNGLRAVAVDVDCSALTGSSLVVMAALTSGFAYPSSGNLAFDHETAPIGRSVVSLQLEAETTRYQRAQFRCRNTSATASVYTSLAPIYLWVGWYSTGASDAIIGISARQSG